jgi:hypothetical protein
MRDFHSKCLSKHLLDPENISDLVPSLKNTSGGVFVPFGRV